MSPCTNRRIREQLTSQGCSSAHLSGIHLKAPAASLCMLLALNSSAVLGEDSTANCTVVNLMPTFWASLEGPAAPSQLRGTLIDTHPELYNTRVVDLSQGVDWQQTVAREQNYVTEHRDQVIGVTAYLSEHVSQYMRDFQRIFPSFRCDFTVYIAPSFDHMDGTAMLVDGEYRLLLAPDVIPRYHELGQLKVLVDHETFHVYHHQVTGVYGASEETLPTILDALWSEGLAVLVSSRMNPAVSLDGVLFQPDIPAGTKSHLRTIAADLLKHLDEKDKRTFAYYFRKNKQPKGYPSRSGYYVGMLIAKRLTAHYTLQQLAQLKGPVLKDAIVSELSRLATTG